MPVNQLKAGVFLSYILLVLNTLIGLLYTPFLIRMLGPSDYGLYSLAISVIGYLTVLDLGFGNAIVRYTSKFRAEGKLREQEEMFGMFFIIYWCISALAFIIAIILIWNTENLFSSNMTAEEIKRMRIILLVMSFNLAFTFPMSLWGAIITAPRSAPFLTMPCPDSGGRHRCSCTNKPNRKRAPRGHCLSRGARFFLFNFPNGSSNVNLGLQHTGVVFVLAVLALAHGHKPGGHQSADFPSLMDRAGDPLLLPVLSRVVETDQGAVLRHTLPLHLQHLAHQAVNHVVAADNGGVFGEPLQKAVDGTGKPLIMGLVGHAPLDIVVLELHPPLLHGGGSALELLNTLVVVIDEDTRDVPVAPLNEQADEPVGALHVVDDDPGTVEIFVVVVIEDDGDPPPVDLFVAVQIGIEQAGLDSIDDKPLKVLVDHGLQAAALVGELVVGEKYPQVHLIGGKHAFNAFQQFRVGVGILALEDETDFQRSRAGAQLSGQGDLFIDIGAAALDPLHQPLLGHPVQSGAHGLTAHVQPTAQGIFRGQLQVAGKLVLVDIGHQPAVDLIRLFARASQSKPSPQSVMVGRYPSAFSIQSSSRWRMSALA